jgi:hypothetical protein
MVTEYIKRNQKMGFDQNGVLLYKIPVEEESPVFDQTTDETVVGTPIEDLLFDPLLGDD